MDETATDGPFNLNSSNSRSVLEDAPKLEPEVLYYNMTGEKYLIIFNHYKYKKTMYYGLKRPSPRTGTMEDVAKLRKVFENLNYKVIVHQDLEHAEILEKVMALSKEDHKATSCLCFAFLSHGEKGGDLFAADRPYQLREVTVMLEHGHSSLVGKPKLFFIQACRGDQIDSGRRVELDGAETSIIIPTHADFLILYSSVEDYLSFRDREGSFMIQELCDVIDEYHKEWDILHIITLVHRRVAYYRSTYAPSTPSIHDKKQMPETRFSLTKLFKF
nr:caspase-1-like [Vanessa tameamea]